MHSRYTEIGAMRRNHTTMGDSDAATTVFNKIKQAETRFPNE